MFALRQKLDVRHFLIGQYDLESLAHNMRITYYRKSVTSSVTFRTLLGPTSIFFAAANARSTASWFVVKSRERNAIRWYSPGTSPPMRNWPASSPLAPTVPDGLMGFCGGHLFAITTGRLTGLSPLITAPSIVPGLSSITMVSLWAMDPPWSVTIPPLTAAPL